MESYDILTLSNSEDKKTHGNKGNRGKIQTVHLR